jgi:hypothetical protein
MPDRPRKDGVRGRELRGTIGCINGQAGNKFHLECAADFYYFYLLIAESRAEIHFWLTPVARASQFK